MWELRSKYFSDYKFHLGKLIFVQPLARCDEPSKYRYKFVIIDENAKKKVVIGDSLDHVCVPFKA